MAQLLDNDGGQAISSLSIRDYFAAQALAGLLDNSYIASVNYAAILAYRYADAMLIARQRPEPEP